jgi:hypothetical protein
MFVPVPNQDLDFQRHVPWSPFCVQLVNKNVDIKVSANEASLEYPSSGTLKAKLFENHIIYKSL